MAFGQQSGSPATAKQVQELLSLLHEAGHTDFRDARGPMGFTQRQAGGKFSRDEADAFIAQLQQEAEQAEAAGTAAAATEMTPPAAAPAARSTARPKAKPLASADAALAKVPSETLAAELQRRGWIVVEP
ncbi:MAG: hypothetical protein ABMA25_02700 [Ilumatobacteraceae bacterium]